MTGSEAVEPLRLYWANQYAVSPDQPGGTRHYDFAKELQQRGHDVSLIASDINLSTRQYSRRSGPTDLRAHPERIGGVKFTWLTAGSYRGNNWRRVASMVVFGLATTRHLLRVEKDARTVFIGSSPHLFAALGAWLAAKLRRVPFVFEVRDLWPESYSEVSGRETGPEVTLLRLIADLLYRRSDAIIVLADSNVDRICERGVPRSRITLVPNGVDLHGFENADEGVDLSQPGVFTFVYAGAHGPANDLATVVEAAAELKKRSRDDIGVVLLGDGACKEDLIEQANSLGLENIRFVDPVPKSGIASTLRSADAGLMVLAAVDLFTYGVSPNKLFDYMGAGLPVLANVPGLVADVISRAGVGTTVAGGDPKALADGMEAMADDPPVDAAAHGRKFIEENYDRRKLAVTVESLLSSLRR
ncbi:MAG: glycosyltransferase family 4 protein [Acidimicrobiales bacterium]|nr:glycosyltransferase family 4 protein [Acidimicrobiales bacterium]